MPTAYGYREFGALDRMLGWTRAANPGMSLDAVEAYEQALSERTSLELTEAKSRGEAAGRNVAYQRMQDHYKNATQRTWDLGLTRQDIQGNLGGIIVSKETMKKYIDTPFDYKTASDENGQVKREYYEKNMYLSQIEQMQKEYFDYITNSGTEEQKRMFARNNITSWQDVPVFLQGREGVRFQKVDDQGKLHLGHYGQLSYYNTGKDKDTVNLGTTGIANEMMIRTILDSANKEVGEELSTELGDAWYRLQELTFEDLFQKGSATYDAANEVLLSHSMQALTTSSNFSTDMGKYASANLARNSLVISTKDMKEMLKREKSEDKTTHTEWLRSEYEDILGTKADEK